ncbi:hypothetical protein ACFQ1S_04570 [Kibdelosporangium lantanae]|uniref:Uncharacterized protein n=1 Tax=Kibdelosporangium lantanae TaxID=1497396 RepID=A0ABW3M6H2_9PSEU
MLRSFVVWFDDFLAGEGPSAVVRGILGLLSFAGLLGALLGSAAVKAGVIVAVLLILLGVTQLLLRDRRGMARQLARHRRLVSRYGKVVDEMNPTYEVLSWDQAAHILNSRGDTQESVAISVKVLRGDMRLIRLIFGCGWEQPAKYRRGVRISVRNLLVGDSPGTSREVTHSWVADGKADVMIHFAEAPPEGSEVRFMVTLDWPGKCSPLMNGDTDDFTFRFLHQSVARVSYRIVLPPGYEAYNEPIGFEPGDARFRLDTSTGEDDGRRRYLFRAAPLPVRLKAGVSLELKNVGRRDVDQRRLAGAPR